MSSPLEQTPVAIKLPEVVDNKLAVIGEVEGVDSGVMIVRGLQRLIDIGKRVPRYGVICEDEQTAHREDFIDLANKRCDQETRRLYAAGGGPSVEKEILFYNQFLATLSNAAQEREVPLAHMIIMGISVCMVSAEKELSGARILLVERANRTRWHPYHFLSPVKVAEARRDETAA